MKKFSHALAGFVLVGILFTLITGVYDGLVENYDLTKGDLDPTGETEYNIAEAFKEMNLIEGIARLKTGIVKLSPGSGSNFDIAGGLASVAIGALKTVSGIFTLPYSMVQILLTYYAGEIPGVIGGITMMLVVYVGMILAGIYVNREL